MAPLATKRGKNTARIRWLMTASSQSTPPQVEVSQRPTAADEVDHREVDRSPPGSRSAALEGRERRHEAEDHRPGDEALDEPEQRDDAHEPDEHAVPAQRAASARPRRSRSSRRAAPAGRRARAATRASGRVPARRRPRRRNAPRPQAGSTLGQASRGCQRGRAVLVDDRGPHALVEIVAVRRSGETMRNSVAIASSNVRSRPAPHLLEGDREAGRAPCRGSSRPSRPRSPSRRAPPRRAGRGSPATLVGREAAIDQAALGA